MLWDEPGKAKPLDIIKQLSYLQIDAIFVTARSQDLVLHSRSTSYKEEGVWKFLKSKKILEAFAHARCLVPVDQLPYYYTKMLRKRDIIPGWYKHVAEDVDWREEILERAKNGREIGISDLAIPEKFPKYTGWSSAPKRMLDYLSTRGYLFASRREKFQSYYKLPELLFKEFDNTTSKHPTREEEFLFHIHSTLNAVGPTPLHRLLHYKYIHSTFELDGKRISPRTLVKKYIKDGSLVEVGVETNEGKEENYLYLPDDIDAITNVSSKDQSEYNCFILSPFDNALWSREALLSQYNFDYKMEIYVPAAKRVYGYFTMPVLFGPDFLGRVDVKLDRKTGILYWIKWSWENKYKQYKSNEYFWKKLANTIERFVLFHGVTKTNLGNIAKARQKKLGKLMDILIVNE